MDKTIKPVADRAAGHNQAIGAANLKPIDGITLGATAAEIRYQGRDDVLVIAAEAGASCAAVFTQNAYVAAPVLVSREHLAEATPRALVINAGNANCGTGEHGMNVARESAKAVAEKLGCQPNEVLTFSTGVIGELLPLERLVSGIENVELGADQWQRAANAIMTTDTIAKGWSYDKTIAGKTVAVTGISKGVGMVCPNMATVLSYVATDAQVEQSVLQEALAEMSEVTFNAVTVDGDTSTNDSLVLIATGKSGVTLDKQGVIDLVTPMMQQLSQALVWDGEGATKFITIKVHGAASTADAKQVAYTVAHSPLVMTAFYASDPNWGRILAAVGRSGIEGLNVSTIDIHFDEVCIVQAGGRDAAYTEEAGQRVMDRETITIDIALGMGEAESTMWTSDLSHEYVTINAEYRS